MIKQLLLALSCVLFSSVCLADEYSDAKSHVNVEAAEADDLWVQTEAQLSDIGTLKAKIGWKMFQLQQRVSSGTLSQSVVNGFQARFSSINTEHNSHLDTKQSADSEFSSGQSHQSGMTNDYDNWRSHYKLAVDAYNEAERLYLLVVDMFAADIQAYKKLLADMEAV